MARKASNASNKNTKGDTMEKNKTTTKVNVYDMVTNRIIAQLEKGVIPWRKPWTGVMDGAFNRISKRPYSLLNQLLLEHDGEYASYKQWKSLGGQVRKGEKSEFVVFWKMYPVTEEKVNEDGEAVERIKMVPILRYDPVFHISQVDGIEELKKNEKEGKGTEKGKGKEVPKIEAINSAEEVLNDYWKREGIDVIKRKSNEAYYVPATDKIVLPLITQFPDVSEYYSTALHESVHSTMKESRCNRRDALKGSIKGKGKTKDEYSKEELVAEIGAAMLLSHLGVETKVSFNNNVAYIQSWIRALKSDNKMIVTAASKAEKAAHYILNDETRESEVKESEVKENNIKESEVKKEDDVKESEVKEDEIKEVIAA